MQLSRQHAAPFNSRVKWITRSDSRTYRNAEMKDSTVCVRRDFQDFAKSKSFLGDSVLEVRACR